jgi:tRNA G18 (ribose-2'-O)-methylase SpoU
LLLIEEFSVTGPIVNPDFPDGLAPAFPGDVPALTDTRNVIDHMKGFPVAEIKERLQATALPVTLVAENFAHDFNIATLVRNANAFNVREVLLVGRKKWDRRGAVGTQHYTPVEFQEDPFTLFESLKLRKVPLIVADNVPGAVALPDFTWPEGEIAMLFGQEQIGVSNLALSYADHVVMVPQLGSVRSMNVGTTSGIFLYDYLLRGPGHPQWEAQLSR